MDSLGEILRDVRSVDLRFAQSSIGCQPLFSWKIAHRLPTFFMEDTIFTSTFSTIGQPNSRTLLIPLEQCMFQLFY